MAALLKPSMGCCLLLVWISSAVEGEAPQKRTEGDNVLHDLIVLLSSLQKKTLMMSMKMNLGSQP